MANILGYILSIIGLAGIALSGQITKMLSFLGAKASIYTIIGSVILIIVGITLVMSESKPKIQQSQEEVPIYEGEGKKRKIVGYKKATK